MTRYRVYLLFRDEGAGVDGLLPGGPVPDGLGMVFEGNLEAAACVERVRRANRNRLPGTWGIRVYRDGCEVIMEGARAVPLDCYQREQAARNAETRRAAMAGEIYPAGWNSRTD